MKESHGKGPASHSGPESCSVDREVAAEALTGENADQVLSCEIKHSGVPTLLTYAEGNTGGSVKGELPTDPAQSETLCMRGHSLHGNREVPRAPAEVGMAGRLEKATSRTSGMYARGKSDRPIVPRKPPNKGNTIVTPAEAVEERGLTEGNIGQTAVPWTQSRTRTSNGLAGVRRVARADKRARFTALLHHVTVDLLRESFYALKRQAAPGVDGMTWAQFEVNLEDRLRDLHGRVHRGAYRAQPSKRTFIPKADGRQRPLGIASVEDKVVQQAVVMVLNPIYEEDFLGFSYGFRPGRSQHDALDALWTGIMGKKVNWVLDADIRGFFDAISHEWMMKFLEHRIADRRILRLIRKWLRAGVSEAGTWSKTEMGTPQGAVISPLLANVYLHYVLDLWVHQWRTRTACGDVTIVRYADDYAMGFQHRAEAEQFLKELKERLDKFGLALHPDKTRLIEFGRFAVENRKRRGQGKPETFDFLGFTHICGRKWANRKFTVKRKTVGKRLAAKLREVRATLMRRRHEPVAGQARWLASVVRGYLNYHAVPGNMASVMAFRTQAIRHWLFALRRRSHKHRLPWKRFGPLADKWIPRARILHPYPNERFYAKHPK
ncbi:MAG: group II intron reverse transcriptase/maturase [Phycisphaerae bacterium]|nr:group II intron reverse transcriptase/maturase [Phycisphaerae bacterium]